ncbi:hypothetical protein TRVA0_005S01376 [Trichomonascus vanleenenianus]|uniref:uncharacterized protein n=1 Tax=Trichomonascus vanleenenianus TaxID=2268995 RepID=UPI003ECA989B
MSYAEAAAAGAKAPPSDNPVPIEHSNVTAEEAKEAKEAVHEEKLRNAGIFETAQLKFQGFAQAVSDSLSDPSIAGQLVVSFAATAGVAVGLFRHHQVKELTWWPLGVAYAGAIVLVGGLDFYTVKKIRDNRK